MNITEFLLARIAEDEAFIAAPHRAFGHEVHLSDPIGTYNALCPDCVGVNGGERMRAECAAKRAIIELHDALEDKGWQSGKDHDYLWCGSCGTLDDAPVPYPCETMEALAAVYKDHPDYQQEWSANAG